MRGDLPLALCVHKTSDCLHTAVLAMHIASHYMNVPVEAPVRSIIDKHAREIPLNLKSSEDQIQLESEQYPQ